MVAEVHHLRDIKYERARLQRLAGREGHEGSEQSR
jgi:hypothetical protein